MVEVYVKNRLPLQAAVLAPATHRPATTGLRAASQRATPARLHFSTHARRIADITSLKTTVTMPPFRDDQILVSANLLRLRDKLFIY